MSQNVIKSINERQYRTPKLSGGAPFFNMCLCLQTREIIMFIYIAEYTKHFLAYHKLEDILCSGNKYILCLDVYAE